jgi:hypothetical protein
MKYWVVHREQVTLKFIIEQYDYIESAELRREDLIQQYHDVLIVNQMDINEMFLQSRTIK